MGVVLERLPPLDATDEEAVSEDAQYLLPLEGLSALGPPQLRLADRDGDAFRLKPLHDRACGPEFLEQVEDLLDQRGRLGISDQLPRFVRIWSVADCPAAVPQAPVNPIEHDGLRSFTGHLPLHLGEDDDELEESVAERRGGVEVLADAENADPVFFEQLPEFGEVGQVAGDPIELVADDLVDLTGGDVPFETLELRSVLVLGTPARIFVVFEMLDGPALKPALEFDVPADLVLLCFQAVAILTPIIEMPTTPRKRSRRPLRLATPVSVGVSAEHAVAIAEDTDQELWPTTTPAAERGPCETAHHEKPQPAEQPIVSNKQAPVVEEMPPIPEQQPSTAAQAELPVSIPARSQPLPDLSGTVDDWALRYAEENRTIERELMDQPDTPAFIRKLLETDRETRSLEQVQLIGWAVNNERRRRRGEQPRPVPKNLEDVIGYCR